MDSNGLNINRPLLSVRRSSSIASSSSQKKSKPSRESSKTESTSVSTMKSGSVPFVWEQSPGRPKNERNKQTQIMENLPSLPKLSPGRFFRPRKMIKSPKSTKKESSNPRKDDGHVANDKAYVDVLDTLSRGETSFYNCSAATGVSGDVKQSGFLRADTKTRDFMLGRFLPAARAMASDVPQHTSRKGAVKEKTRQVKEPVNLMNKGQLRYGPNFLQDVAHDKEGDDYDSDYEYIVHGKKSSKFCGLIPRFRSVNLVHGTCVRSQLPISQIQASSSSSSSFRETASEPSRSGVYKHRSLNSLSKSLSLELANLEGSKLYNRLQGPAISVDHSGSYQSTVSEKSDSSSKKKGTSFREFLTDTNTNEITEKNSQDSTIEKTLYVDTVRIIESPKQHSFPACIKPQSSFNEPLESDDESIHDLKTKGFKDTVEFELFGDTKGNQKLKASETWVFQHPPLPKSPSDSWLCRTLPSVSSKRAAPILWIPKYSSSNIVVSNPKTDETINLQSPQEEMNAVPES